ncbi:MAG: hypothetical protein [Arizlama microvirus]|nr:MAG: hypothetical protein [Arizlama microvirus]
MAYQFKTLQDYEPEEGYTPDQKMPSMTEQAGYRTIKSEIEEMMAAGLRADDWRKQQYPAGSQDFIAPQFMDKLDALEMRKQARAELDRVQEAGDAELKKLADAEREKATQDAEELALYRAQKAAEAAKVEPPK